jgi:tetratricopeptide (TPR) repeat protein
MAEHGPEAEVTQAAEAGTAPALEPSSATAISLALGRTDLGARSDPDATEFLREQTRMLRLQMEHLHEQRQLVLSRLRWGRFSDRVKAALQLMTGLVGLFIVVAIGAMAWGAHEDHGVAIEAFSVPPDLAQRGLTGQVVASKLLDRLAELQARTVTGRPASTYANDWGGDIKVEIPETGVSIGELNRYLRQWLGSETRISGEVVRTPAGLAVTARAGANSGATFEGADAELDSLVQKSAEAIYRQTQPYRYAVYLASHGRSDEAIAAYAGLARSGNAEEQAWAYTGWATLLLQRRDFAQALAKATRALELDPRIDPAQPIQGLAFNAMGRKGDVLAQLRTQLRLLESGRAKGISPEGARLMRDYVKGGLIPFCLGDFTTTIATLSRMSGTIDFEGIGGAYSLRANLFAALLGSYDVSGARRVLGRPPDPSEQSDIAFALEDWANASNTTDAAKPPDFWARKALLLARLGRLAEAEAAIAPTPLDCADCLMARGTIRGRAGDRKGADRWFAEASRRMGAAPNAYQAWGQSLLELGDPDAAIAKLKQAHRLGPRWADPLELWGEALMAKGDWAGAIGKFAEADKDAPRWGKTHLHWGEALLRSGRYREARAQFEAANGMDLSRPDRAALDVFLNRTARGPLHG